MRKMNKVAPIVAHILRTSEEARNSDTELLIQFLELQGFGKMSEAQKLAFRKVSFESITRARRKFQEEGQFLPNEKVGKQRRLKSMIVQQNAPTARPARIQQLADEQPKAVPWM